MPSGGSSAKSDLQVKDGIRNQESLLPGGNMLFLLLLLKYVLVVILYFSVKPPLIWKNECTTTGSLWLDKQSLAAPESIMFVVYCGTKRPTL